MDHVRPWHHLPGFLPDAAKVQQDFRVEAGWFDAVTHERDESLETLRIFLSAVRLLIFRGWLNGSTAARLPWPRGRPW